MKKTRSALFAVTLLAACYSTGCSRPWDTARTVVNVAAAGVAAGTDAAVEAYESSPCEGARELELLETCVAELEAMVQARQLCRSILLEGEALVDLWEQAGTEPESWRGWATRAAAALARLVGVLEAAGVELPPELAEAAETVDNLVQLIGG